jgi:hypothetical protein
MMLAAYLHGTPGRLPFVGHFRSARSNDALSFAVAGRVDARGDISVAFRGARTLESTLLGVKLADCADRHGLLQALWDAITAVDGFDLGREGGADLVVLLVVRDSEGTGIAGAGLGGVWDWSEGELNPVVTNEHPLLNGPGRPEQLPGVLTLDIQSDTLVAVAHDHPVPTLQRTDLARLCGVNP